MALGDEVAGQALHRRNDVFRNQFSADDFRHVPALWISGEHPHKGESGSGQSAFAASDAAKPKVAKALHDVKAGALLKLPLCSLAAQRDGGSRCRFGCFSSVAATW